MANTSNLKPFKKGYDPRRSNGRPKGSVNLSSVVRTLLNDETIADKIITNKPGWWDSLTNKRMSEAIIVSIMLKAINGDVKSAEWLTKTAYGNQYEPESEQPRDLIIINEVPARQGAKRTINTA